MKLWPLVHSFTLFTNLFFAVRFTITYVLNFFPHYMFNPLFLARREDWHPSSNVGSKVVLCVVCISYTELYDRSEERRVGKECLL